jgi:hypothetical protein
MSPVAPFFGPEERKHRVIRKSRAPPMPVSVVSPRELAGLAAPLRAAVRVTPAVRRHPPPAPG